MNKNSELQMPKNGKRPYLVVVIDVATTDWRRDNPPIASHHIVLAASAEEAEEIAVGRDNEANDYGPDDDGGFMAIWTYDLEDLERFLADMEATAQAH